MRPFHVLFLVFIGNSFYLYCFALRLIMHFYQKDEFNPKKSLQLVKKLNIPVCKDIPLGKVPFIEKYAQTSQCERAGIPLCNALMLFFLRKKGCFVLPGLYFPLLAMPIARRYASINRTVLRSAFMEGMEGSIASFPALSVFAHKEEDICEKVHHHERLSTRANDAVALYLEWSGVRGSCYGCDTCRACHV